MSDDGEDVIVEKKSKPSGVRGRRGFSKKKVADQENNAVISESSAVYSTRVTKCFNDLVAHKIDSEIMRHAIADNKDVDEEDCFATKKTSAADKSKDLKRKKKTENVPTEEILQLSDEEVDVQPSTVCSTPDLNLSTNSFKSRSPTPPPEPKQLRQLPKNRRMKKNVKKAMASLTQSLTAAKSQLKETVNITTPDKDVCVIDDDDDDLTVRVDIMGRIHRFLVNSEEPFSILIAKIATQQKEETRNIMLVHNDRTIRPNDIPQSIGLRAVDIVTCHIRTNCNDSFNDSLSYETEDGSLIEIVLQSRESRQKEIIKAHPDKPLKAVMVQYAGRLNKDLSCLKFWFDGEIITDQSIPSDLDMEDGDVMDVQMIS